MIYAVIIDKAYSIGYLIEKEGYKAGAMTKMNQYDFILQTEPWFILRKCDYLLHLNQYDKAIAGLEAAKTRASNKIIYLKLGDLYAYQKKYNKAEAQYRFVYYALPGLIQPRYLLARLYYESHKTAKWETAANGVLTFNPKVVSWMTNDMKSDIRRLMVEESKP